MPVAQTNFSTTVGNTASPPMTIEEVEDEDSDAYDTELGLADNDLECREV